MRKHERQFEAIFNDPNLLVALLDNQGIVKDVNETALAYIDETRHSIIGEPFWESPWWTPDQQSNVKEWIAEAAAGEYIEYEADHPTGAGQPISVEGSFRPVTAEDGSVVRIVASANDVTERKEQKHELQRRNERFDEFASFISHDLQSPVATVSGRLELALETGEMEHVQKAREAIDRVDSLRTDLVTTLRTGEIVGDTAVVSIEAILEDVWLAVDPPTTASYTVVDNPRVEADRDALQRMLENLVGNSIEHGPEVVEIQVGEQDAGFYYEDAGPGIELQYRDQVFTPGFSTKHGEQGIGMGMASVRQIVLAHGWEISIKDGNHLSGVRFEINT